MGVLPDARTIVSSPVGDLTFTPSGGGGILYYEARVYVSGTSSPLLATQYLGVSGADAVTGFIKVNIARMLGALAPGTYDVRVAATDAGGTTESTDSNVFDVPLHP